MFYDCEQMKAEEYFKGIELFKIENGVYKN